MTYDDLIGKTMLTGITYMRDDEVEEDGGRSYD